MDRPLRFAGQLALFVFASVSCQSGDGANPLLPDEHTRYHVSDRLGSAALVLDHQGKPVARDAHNPYGAPALAWRADGERGPDYRFTGAEDTPRSGAVVLGARHYLPALGRWTAPDPYYLLNPGANLDHPGERNLYRYAGNNPVQHIDPSGHGWISWVIKAGARLYKGVDKANEVASAVEDISVVLNPEAGLGARVLSAVSLGTEYLPVSIGDLKDGVRWLRGSDKVLDAAASVRAGERSAWDTARELSSGAPAITRKPGAKDGPRARMNFKPEHTPVLLEENRMKNNGRVLCENCGTAVIPPQKSMRGVTPPKNEWQRDHIIPRAIGGNGSPENGQILCRGCNRAKGAK